MKFLAILIASGTFFKFKYFYFCLCRKRNGSGSFRGAYESDEEIAYVGLGINGYVWYRMLPAVLRSRSFVVTTPYLATETVKVQFGMTPAS